MIEGAHDSLAAVMQDQDSTTQHLIDFAGNAEDAVRRCNDDKASARKLLNGD